MGVEVNGIAHIQMTVNNIEKCMPFWEGLCHFLEMKTLIKNDTTLYVLPSGTVRSGREIRENRIPGGTRVLVASFSGVCQQP